ncbi:MAG TPA: DUF1028 domain-containing protein [Polyangiaceae bacterium]|nr:DUF1028 domain-containing protein [Polyangiaceae bacterium]
MNFTLVGVLVYAGLGDLGLGSFRPPPANAAPPGTGFWRGAGFGLAMTCGVIGAAPGDAWGTYSITAFDRESGALGGAGASCVPYAVDVIYGVVPGRGAFNMQAWLDDALHADALALVAEGKSAAELLRAVTDNTAYPNAQRMQWGVVTSAGDALAWSGSAASPYAGHQLLGEDSRYTATFQGNLLTSDRVLIQARAAFSNAGCDLAERLMLSLEAAGVQGEGDRRCTPDGRPANSAYLDVTLPEGPWLHLSVPDVAPSDPIVVLRALFEQFRSKHPCPSASEAGAPPSQADAAPGPIRGPEASTRTTGPGCSVAMPTRGGAATHSARSSQVSTPALLWAGWGALLSLLLRLNVRRWRTTLRRSRVDRSAPRAPISSDG